MSQVAVPDDASPRAIDRCTIVYDGSCPVCNAFVRMLRLRAVALTIELINARDGGPVVERLRAAGYLLDEGIVLMLDSQTYHGADAMHMLALLSTPSASFNLLTARAFRNRTLSRFSYPALKLGRLLLLKIIGRDRMGY